MDSSSQDIASLQDVCQVSQERASELLEAASGNVERAISIHFGASTNTQTEVSSPTKRKSQSPNSKQSSLDSFLALSPSKTKKKRSSQTTLLSTAALDSVTKQPAAVLSNQTTGAPSPDSQSKPKTASPIVPTNGSTEQPPPLEYLTVAKALSELTDTTKRTLKLHILQQLFETVIEHLGGIRKNCSVEESYPLVFVLDLVLGKLSIVTISEIQSHAKSNNTPTPPPPPLQVSGSAVSQAVQTITGSSRSQLSSQYRSTGDLGDCAAHFFRQAQQSSVARYFVKSSPASSAGASVQHVHEHLQRLTTVASGTGSQATRQSLVTKLLGRCKQKEEMRFLVRFLLNNMRLGATLKTVLVALAHACNKFQGVSDDKNSSPKRLEETYNICPRIPILAHALLRGGVRYAAEHCSLTVGVPIQPMLANPASNFDTVRDFMTLSNDKDKQESSSLSATLEWKYDGVRCQAHCSSQAVQLFSRHLLDNTEQFPDVVQYLLDAKSDSVESFVVDAEIVGVQQSDDATNPLRLLPFQDLSTRRGTKQQDDNQIQVCVFCFDVMYLNGTSLLKEPLWKRQEMLRAHFTETGHFQFAASIHMPRYDESLVRKALEDAVTGGAEGLMIKLTGEQQSSDSTSTEKGEGDATVRAFGYESGVRGKLWLKLKRDYVQGYADTIDVVPIGAWYGSGRKAQKDFLSPVLLAVYDEEEETFQSISRCMSFSDAMYSAMREFYFRGTPYPPGVGVDEDTGVNEDATTKDSNVSDDSEILNTEAANVSDDDAEGVLDRVNCLPTRPSLVGTNENPTIWFKPSEVFEVSFADLSLSRAHTAASSFVADSRGIAMRFPRFKRRRPDKSIEQATTAAQIAELFRQQSKIK